MIKISLSKKQKKELEDLHYKWFEDYKVSGYTKLVKNVKTSISKAL
ncbi:hypothetical protein [Fusibacter ferrireducens]|uniref:Uncharacterized protein n=1 Tax=Fusibacter ferrireducens TaxID=2785058 RepID=A0ABR9ZS95_9FIRM|nr:hypothetical protein [Fusibacter ferrireducens]MBF4693339.1 hypothetical protein [Fusibacter ferrireducens]